MDHIASVSADLLIKVLAYIIPLLWTTMLPSIGMHSKCNVSPSRKGQLKFQITAYRGMLQNTAKVCCTVFYSTHHDFGGIPFSSFSLLPVRSRPPITAKWSGGARKLPQRVPAEPGRQMYFIVHFRHKFAPF